MTLIGMTSIDLIVKLVHRVGCFESPLDIVCGSPYIHVLDKPIMVGMGTGAPIFSGEFN
jgi:hypothetical protein